MKKLALIGSHPASVLLAPYSDPSVVIWGCSPGAAFSVKRADAWFELHHFDVANPLDTIVTKDYLSWLANFHGTVYCHAHIPQIPNSKAYPKDRVLEQFGRYFFTSSLSWMLALALLEPDLEEIGLFGVDMSSVTEYGYQRAGCHYFITLAQSRGIKITVPPQSDLLQPPELYGYGQASRMAQKLQSRAAEIDKAIAEHEQKHSFHKDQWLFFKGVRDDIQYMLNTFMTEEPEQKPAVFLERRSADVLAIHPTAKYIDTPINHNSHKVELR